MTPETAQLLARALTYRNEAEVALVNLEQARRHLPVERSPAIDQSMVTHAEAWVHEIRVLTRIFTDATD